MVAECCRPFAGLLPSLRYLSAHPLLIIAEREIRTASYLSTFTRLTRYY